MRVIGGEARGRRLAILRGRTTRPTADRVKESLFNILGEKVVEAEVLDLFAGVGSLGIEALSRGARKAVFVDKKSSCARVIRGNLETLGFSERAEVYEEEANKAIKFLDKRGRKFGLLLVDPPYSSDLAEAAGQELAKSSIIDDGGVVVVEHYRKKVISQRMRNLKLTREEQYGNTVLSFYRR
ncbi:16S rRNA (guanine(966)-N(2))-methyltransferase RsmD [bacterium]|nr:16S rRNA (guanine(966)-N(2))-methyltransferase RsmD [bacterium]